MKISRSRSSSTAPSSTGSTSAAAISSPSASAALCRACFRIAEIALNRPADTSHDLRIGRHALLRPLFQRGPDGVVQRVFGEVEVAEQPDEGREDVAGLAAVDRLEALVHRFRGVAGHERGMQDPPVGGGGRSHWKKRTAPFERRICPPGVKTAHCR